MDLAPEAPGTESDSRWLFHGRIIQLSIDRVRLPNGEMAELEIVHHPGGAAVVALDEADRVCLLRQFRHAAGGWLWELPAGKIDGGEDPQTTAWRELEEEAGVAAARWVPLGGVISSPGIFTEVVYLYLAQDLRPLAHHHERHEVIAIHWLPLTEALAWAERGEIADGKTLVGLFRAAAHLKQIGTSG